MGQQQSRDELVHELVYNGNVEAIKALHREGAGLEWIDREGKTPLIVACMDPRLYNVAKTLIELKANVNAYRPGRHAGTPLHHAAKRGLDQTVKLLLSHGANALVRNDDCQTPLDAARIKGYGNVVRTIENHICYFAGWLREIYGPGFLEALAPQLLSRKIWAVVVPCGPNNPTKPLKMELVIYTTLQDAQPRTVIALSKAKIEEPKFHQSDPALIIFDNSTKTRYKLASASEGDRSEIQRLYNACRGIPQEMPPVILNAQTSVAATATQSATEAAELAMAINASLQSASGDRPSLLPNVHQTSEASNTNGWGNSADNASHNGWGLASGPTHSEASSSGWINEPANEKCDGWGVPESGTTGNPTGTTGNPTQHNTNGWGSSTETTNHNGSHPTGGLKHSEASSSGWINKPANEEYNGWGVPESGATGNPIQHIHTQDKITPAVLTNNEFPGSYSADPSAPPITEEGLDEGPIHYPSIDLSPLDLSVPPIEAVPSKASDGDDGGDSSSCVICWEAPVEGACIPCGHMAGCMSCLNEIKAKKGVCPVCRAQMDRVIKLYAV